MKKILVLFAMVLGFAIQSQAQVSTLLPLVAGDTLSNTDTVQKVLTLSAGYTSLAFQPIVSKISGTVAGKIYLSYSLDGTNYIKTDSVSLSDQTTNTTLFAKNTAPAQYYKVWATSSGTVSAQFRLYYVFRKYSTQ